MSDFQSKLQIPEIPFEDENWEDPSISGWMAFFLISIGLGALLSIGSISHYSYSGFVSFILLLPALYCFYTIIAFVKRWRNAIFLAKSYLIYMLISNIIGILMGQFIYDSGVIIQSIIWSSILCCCWLGWLFKSYRIKIRFPEEHRKAFMGDWIITILILGGLTLFSLISTMVVY